ncbi:uncharacterized protein MYCFIDRAFT_179149 [Pseudocercospora fijiensis CIRAD86]|uniref:Uncharacterized protein n=1 Tax=Pseudocercospora fijiensis (strain CIRAD86) TaxID=383855 RepID=M2ZEU8_PSEFD|nr:uncharacterized protein MYCFIDRAFT_179149 [Pseudocercospora fijiensis CIRAD86]EME77654.1 hypothetical protein MYCFIDRAFT_179149 [Pseudocercospora fijiensis CIRAD86]
MFCKEMIPGVVASDFTAEWVHRRAKCQWQKFLPTSCSVAQAVRMFLPQSSELLESHMALCKQRQKVHKYCLSRDAIFAFSACKMDSSVICWLADTIS